MGTLETKLFPAELGWVIINNLDKFNDKSDMIFELQKKYKQLEYHTLFGKFTKLFDEATDYYERNGSFPDIAYLNKKLPEGKLIKIMKNETYSQSMYEDLMKILDHEIIVKTFKQTIENDNEVNIAHCNNIYKMLGSFLNRNMDIIIRDTKEDWEKEYDHYFENFNGILTGMKELDDTIGVLPSKSLSTFAAPSGHGKSTFAISVAYNAVVQQGKVVDYVSFEVPKGHIRFNIASIESTYTEDNISSSSFKNAELSKEEGGEIYRKLTRSFMNKAKESGGYLQIIDQTEIQAETYEQLCSNLEDIAEKRGFPADLIIIDNIDNLQVLKSSEKDESTKVNQYIISLDKFCKTYCENKGTHIMLLSQVNRTGIKKLISMENNDSKEVSIDHTCIQKFNALYEKPTVVMIGYSSLGMRASNQMKIMPIKLRNKPLPKTPVKLTVEFEYSKVRGGYVSHVPTNSEILASKAEVDDKVDIEVENLVDL